MRFWTAVSLCVRAQIRVPGGLSATRNWRDIVQNSNGSGGRSSPTDICQVFRDANEDAVSLCDSGLLGA